jgi:hypothetical protein
MWLWAAGWTPQFNPLCLLFNIFWNWDFPLHVVSRKISQHFYLFLHCKWHIQHFSFHVHYCSYVSSCERSFMKVRCLYCTKLTWYGGGDVVGNGNHGSEKLINCAPRKRLELHGNKLFLCMKYRYRMIHIEHPACFCLKFLNQWLEADGTCCWNATCSSQYVVQIICHSLNRRCWVAHILTTRIIATLHYRIIS